MSQLQLRDASLNFELEGKGEPVLFIQGCGVTGSGWRPQVDELSADFQCLSFDNRGIGQSTTSSRTLAVAHMVDDARQLLDAVDWKSAHVVGHSLGGVIAQQLALDSPDRVRSLSLLCTFCKGSRGANLSLRTLWMGMRTRIGSRHMRRRAFLQMLFPEQYLRERNLEQLAQHLAPILGRDLAEQPPIMMKQVRALGAHDCSAQLSRLSHVPTLVVSAKEDPIAPPTFGRELAQAIGSATYREIEGASHGVCLQGPQTINQLLRRHIEQAAERKLRRNLCLAN
jgi:pimeloyl-ACP methyl ester carboxylesterase